MLKLSMMTYLFLEHVEVVHDEMKRLRLKNDPQMMSGTYLFLEHVEVVYDDTNEEVEIEE